jgi:hypothetical protein
MSFFGIRLDADATPLTLRFEQKRTPVLSESSDLYVGKRELTAAASSVGDYFMVYATRIRAARRLLWREGISPWDFRAGRKATPQ